MEEYYLDLPSAFCARQLGNGTLEKVSNEMRVELKLRDHRLHVRAEDATTAISAVCQLIVGLPKLGTHLKNQILDARATGAPC